MRWLQYSAPKDSMLSPGECKARDRKSTRLNSSHGYISYAVFCLKKKTTYQLFSYEQIHDCFTARAANPLVPLLRNRPCCATSCMPCIVVPLRFLALLRAFDQIR